LRKISGKYDIYTPEGKTVSLGDAESVAYIVEQSTADHRYLINE
jgi:hypothetical protein